MPGSRWEAEANKNSWRGGEGSGSVIDSSDFGKGHNPQNTAASFTSSIHSIAESRPPASPGGSSSSNKKSYEVGEYEEGDATSSMGDIDPSSGHMPLFLDSTGVDYFVQAASFSEPLQGQSSTSGFLGSGFGDDHQRSTAHEFGLGLPAEEKSPPTVAPVVLKNNFSRHTNVDTNDGVAEATTVAADSSSVGRGLPDLSRIRITAFTEETSARLLGADTQPLRRFRCPCCRHSVLLSLTEECAEETYNAGEEEDDDEEKETVPLEPEPISDAGGVGSGTTTVMRFNGDSVMHRILQLRSTPSTRRQLQLQHRRPSAVVLHQHLNTGSQGREITTTAVPQSERLYHYYHHPHQEQHRGEHRQGGSSNENGDSSLFPLLPTFSPTSFVRAYVGEGNYPWEATLHNRPALIVAFCVAVMSFLVVQFLQHHVLDTRDHLGLFVVGTYLILSSYYLAYYFLERYAASFRRISQDKKFYTIANLIKAGILVSLVPFATLHLSRIILFDVWDTNTLRNLGCIYTVPDFVSMIVVKRMSWSTWMHHLCVLLFNFFSTTNDYAQENICRCVVVYAAFSTFAYCVNVLLASRFLGVPPNTARVLSCIAVVVYIFCCATNWTWQVYYLRKLLRDGHDHWTVYAYMFLICLVMYDDITLNKWLLHNAKSTAFAAAQHQQHQRWQQEQRHHQQQQQQQQ
ncbi:hypothetical protein DQ04_00041200 [Trypanosoma grayi]|uniref:hypothetical protein n=1 Tax=Trypanosoma grayi TaxID=71804 RepID=UPI0004F3FE7A|nr:hypothetical protein DQ04_00041200 [Trypanosoma grayi]KEG15556.1 hypothetical protein DQ04_00041200 [Trypanosoma grayi]